MMDLAQRLPDSVTYGGRRYKLRTEFFRVLQCFEIIRNQDFLPEDQIAMCLKILVRGRIPPTLAARVDLFKSILEQYINPEKPKKKQPKAMDFEHDAKYIFAGFMQAYHIDLTCSTLHWWSFLALLACLPDDTKMAQIIHIRTCELPKPTKHNAEQRAKLIRLKAEWAVHKTDEERARELQEGLKKMVVAMESMTAKR